MTSAVRLDDLIALVKSRHADGAALEEPRDALVALEKSRPADGAALEELGDAVVIGEHLGEVADHLIGHFVDQARRAGASWTDIGKSMGVTKQAAQKRFVPRAEPTTLDPEQGFGRFTPRARNAVVGAQNAAHG